MLAFSDSTTQKMRSNEHMRQIAAITEVPQEIHVVVHAVISSSILQIPHTKFHGKSPLESSAFLILVRISRAKIYGSRPHKANLSRQSGLPHSSRPSFNRHRGTIAVAFYASSSVQTSQKLNETLFKLAIWPKCILNVTVTIAI
jgi:hypothetical protein